MRSSRLEVESLESRLLLATSLISIGNAVVVQSSSPSVAAFQVTLNQPSTQTISVNYATALGGTASSTDFAAAKGTLTFAPGQTEETINVQVNAGTAPAADKTFLVNLLPPSSGSLANGVIVDNMGLGTIVNDNPAVYTPTGPFDPTFGQNGVVEQTDTISQGNAVAVDSNDRTIIAGGAAGEGGYLAVARYNPNGQLYTTFNGTGVVTDNDNGPAGGVAVYQSGPNQDKILVVANDLFGEPDFTIERFNVDGSLDQAFGDQGAVFSNQIESPLSDLESLQVNGIAIYQSGPEAGKFVIVGTANNQLMVARFNADGSLDPSFNGYGVVFLPPLTEGGRTAGNALTLTSSGEILVAGSATTSPLSEATAILLAQFNDDGSLNQVFGSSGVVFPTPPTPGNYQANAVALDAGGNIVAAGSGGSDAVLARFTANGTLDRTFNGTGFEVGLPLPPSNGSPAVPETYNGVVVTADGKIVAVGAAEGDGRNEAFVVRDNANGSPDATFDPAESAGTPGVLVLPVPSLESDVAQAVALDSQGNILVGGTTYAGQGPSFLLARIEPDRANLVVSATVSPDPAAPGQQLVYTVTVSNTGDPADFVSLSASFPSFTTAATLLSAPAGWFIDSAFPTGTSLVALDRGLTQADGPQTFLFAVPVDLTAATNSTLVATFTVNSATLEQEPGPEARSATVATTVGASAESTPTPTALAPTDPGAAPPPPSDGLNNAVATIAVILDGAKTSTAASTPGGSFPGTSFVAIFLASPPSPALEAFFAVGGGDLVEAVVAPLAISVLVPGALQGSSRESASANDGRQAAGLESVGGQVARALQVEGVPDNPVAQLAAAPVEVNVLKVISSLNDGGTNVLHFEQMLRAVAPGTPVAACIQQAVAEPLPGTSLSTPTSSAGAARASLTPVRTWAWWLTGGLALFGFVAVLGRCLVPRWLSRSQTA